mgnify:CR=1 FL=1
MILNNTHAKLNQARAGEKFILEFIPSSIKAELIRMGLCEGDKIECLAKIPGGPVVLIKDLQEIAIGNNYAKDIQITKI